MSFESFLASMPAPSEAAMAHSEELAALIRSEIEGAGGSIGFDRYMDLSLYAPGLGYYAAGARKFAESGDFVTAPEISSLFSVCLAKQVAEILALIGGGDIVEVGAGTGALAGDLMQALLEIDAPPRRYLILETSADLKQRQMERIKEKFPASVPYIDWIDGFPHGGLHGVLIANELLDAFPASRFQIVGETISEVAVGWDKDRFVWINRRPGESLEQYINTILDTMPHALPSGYVSDLSMIREAWLLEMLRHLKKGVALLFDYGYTRVEYYHPQRIDGTLSCYYRHRVHDNPFVFHGLQDITTHVDFTALASVARRAHAQILGFTTQANFLLSTGVLEWVNEVVPGSREHVNLTSQLKRLILPGEMGELVKVLALSQGVDHQLTGFFERDAMGQL